METKTGVLSVGEFSDALTPQVLTQLQRTAFKITRSQEDAEDIVQSSLARAVQYLDRFNGKSSIKTWLTRIVMNQSFDKIRKSKIQRQSSTFSIDEENDFGHTFADGLAASGRGAVDRLIGASDASAFTQAFSRLSQREQAVILSFHEEGRSLREIGKELGTTENTAKNMVVRARSKLRHAMQEQGYAPETRRPTRMPSQGKAPSSADL